MFSAPMFWTFSASAASNLSTVKAKAAYEGVYQCLKNEAYRQTFSTTESITRMVLNAEAYSVKLPYGLTDANDDNNTNCKQILFGFSTNIDGDDLNEGLIPKNIRNEAKPDPSTLKKFFEEHGITTIDVLYNNSFEYEGIKLCGTKGWFFEEEKSDSRDEKVFRRELGRLEASLAAAGEERAVIRTSQSGFVAA